MSDFALATPELIDRFETETELAYDPSKPVIFTCGSCQRLFQYKFSHVCEIQEEELCS